MASTYMPRLWLRFRSLGDYSDAEHRELLLIVTLRLELRGGNTTARRRAHLFTPTEGTLKMSNSEPLGCSAVILSLLGIRLGNGSLGAVSFTLRQRDDFLSPAELSSIEWPY